MSDEQREGFSFGYKNNEDRNGDGIADREQQGFDPSTGRPLDETPSLTTPYNLDFAQNSMFNRETRESTAHYAATFDTSRENSRNPEARAVANEAVGKQSEVERAIESKPKSEGPGFAEKEMARNLWQERYRRPKRDASLLKRLGSVKTGHHEPKTGTEFAQSFLHGLGAGLMVGIAKQKEKAAQRAYDTTEEWMLDQARAKDQEASNEEALKKREDAAKIRDAVLAGAGNSPEGGTPGGDAPGGGTPGGGPEGGPSGGPGGGRDESTRAVETPLPANDVDPERAPGREPEQAPAVAAREQDQQKGEATRDPAKPDAGRAGVERTSSSVDPARANGNVAAGAALATVAPVAAPIVTAGAARHAQKEVGAEHQVHARTKGPAGQDRATASPVERRPGAPTATATRTLAPPPSGPRRENVVAMDEARHRKGGLHAQAAGLSLPQKATHSKGPSVSMARRPAVGMGTLMAKAVIAARGTDDRIVEIARDKRAASR